MEIKHWLYKLFVTSTHYSIAPETRSNEEGITCLNEKWKIAEWCRVVTHRNSGRKASSNERQQLPVTDEQYYILRSECLCHRPNTRLTVRYSHTFCRTRPFTYNMCIGSTPNFVYSGELFEEHCNHLSHNAYIIRIYQTRSKCT